MYPQQSEQLKVAHILPTLDKKFGGPVSVATEIIHELERQGIHATIYPFSDTPSRLRNVLDIRKIVENADIVHIHCLWNLNSTAAGFWARKMKKPYVLTPHGMLDTWALRQSTVKKAIFAKLFENRNLRGASKVQFLNDEEHVEAQSFIPNLQSFILPNGVNFERYDAPFDPQGRDADLPQLEGKTVALFLGRVHPKKGFDILLPSFAEALKSSPSLHLVIAGPKQAEYESALIELSKSLGILNNITFFGFVQGNQKLALLKRADFFVLPSHQEGDSVAVKEALYCGLPVLITPACHFPEVQRNRAGAVVPPNNPAWTDAIVAIAESEVKRKKMGVQGRDLIREKYGWQAIVSHLAEIYLDLLQDEQSTNA